MGDYVSLAEMQTWVGVSDSHDDDLLTAAISSAERAVDTFCGRTFTLAGSATARPFHTCTTNMFQLPVGNDISSTTGLIVKTDDDDDGTFETTWTISTDFLLEPTGGVGGDGRTGWPYTAIRPVGTKWLPVGGLHPQIQITAAWGWPAVPAQVKHATLLIAAELAKLKDAALGFAGFGDLGVVRVFENPKAAMLLSRYARGAALSGIA